MPTYPPHVMVQITARVPRGRQGCWDVIRTLHADQGEWTVADIRARCNGGEAIGKYVRILTKGGYVEVLREEDVPGKACKPAKVYRLVRNQPDAPALRADGTPARDVGRGQDQIWRALKMARGPVSLKELQLQASTEDCPVPLGTVEYYVKHLFKAGYLTRPAPGTYRLKPGKNTGPLAPAVYRSDWVYDRNLQQGFGPTGGVGVDAGGDE